MNRNIRITRIAWAAEGEILRDKSLDRGISALCPQCISAFSNHTAEQISRIGTVVFRE